MGFLQSATAGSLPLKIFEVSKFSGKFPSKTTVKSQGKLAVNEQRSMLESNLRLPECDKCDHMVDPLIRFRSEDLQMQKNR